VTATARREFETINPATGERLERYTPHSPAEIAERLDRAARTFARRRGASFGEHAALLRAVAAELRRRADELARTITLEMGKPIAEARAEVAKCAAACDYFAEHGAEFLHDVPLRSESAAESYAAFRPLGTVLAIMPWNFPLWQVFRFAAPALAAGNTAVLKHAANVTGCALEIERVFRDASAPEGLFTTLIVPGAEAGKLIEDSRIAAVSLTGSEAAGASVAAAAGREIKKTVLELGGSDAFIVLGDADLVGAAKTAARSRFKNAGQSCIAAKRFIVENAVYELFLEAFAEETRKLCVGDPLDEATDVGPMAREDLRETLDRQVSEARSQGARVVTGGSGVDRIGFFYPPTIVAGVAPRMRMFDEETFGPAAAVVRANDPEHAIALANDSRFGLGGNLWTRDIERARRIAERLESGGVFINGMTTSEPALPFGGIKKSGYGRELSAFGIREFVNVQTIWIGGSHAPSRSP
jgi:succinate-semialdehyde dehydrogenase/glutarate-semialdehyde dehydrogenase